MPQNDILNFDAVSHFSLNFMHRHARVVQFADALNDFLRVYLGACIVGRAVFSFSKSSAT